LVLAFKILKRGFCLFKDNSKSKKEEEKNSQDEINSEDDNINLNEYDNDNYIKVPIALPSGMCLFNSLPIKKFEQDYEVTCTYSNNLTYDNFARQIIDQNITIANDILNIYHVFSNTENVNKLKKLEIFYLNEEKKYKINYYLEYKTDNDYQDLTFVIKNLKNEKDFHKSGNPGYIKGKPILIGQKGEKKISKFINDIVFPVTEPYKCVHENKNMTIDFFYYYDNYIDNKLTFEDLIFYKYTDTNLFNEIINDLKSNELNSKLYYGIFGNANLKYEKDWEKISIDIINENNNLLLLGVYMDYGLVNNTQFKIQEFEIKDRDIQRNSGNENYFIMKFLYKNDTKNEWWYSPGPGFVIRVPKNWMYPFQIGTTTYRTKN
jgi:hypothetical protein